MSESKQDMQDAPDSRSDRNVAKGDPSKAAYSKLTEKAADKPKASPGTGPEVDDAITLPDDRPATNEEKIDQALDETFPASDPISPEVQEKMERREEERRRQQKG